MLIAFLSDFGSQEEWAGVCKGVMTEIAPGSPLIDLSHSVAPYDLRKGAFILAAALPHLRPCVCLAVVDPGVGGQRRALALDTVSGHRLVGPDNGILVPAIGLLNGATRAVEISNHPYRTSPVHPTFHGRDLFAPAAAHLSLGASLSLFGEEVDLATLQPAPWSEPLYEKESWACQAIDVDRFGNVRLNLRSQSLTGAKEGTRMKGLAAVTLGGDIEISVPLLATFSQAPQGEPLLYADSSGYVALGLNMGSFAASFKVLAGDQVLLRRKP